MGRSKVPFGETLNYRGSERPLLDQLVSSPWQQFTSNRRTSCVVCKYAALGFVCCYVFVTPTLEKPQIRRQKFTFDAFCLLFGIFFGGGHWHAIPAGPLSCFHCCPSHQTSYMQFKVQQHVK